MGATDPLRVTVSGRWQWAWGSGAGARHRGPSWLLGHQRPAQGPMREALPALRPRPERPESPAHLSLSRGKRSFSRGRRSTSSWGVSCPPRAQGALVEAEPREPGHPSPDPGPWRQWWSRTLQDAATRWSLQEQVLCRRPEDAAGLRRAGPETGGKDPVLRDLRAVSRHLTGVSFMNRQCISSLGLLCF